MCVVFACTKKLPSLAHLQQAEKINDDGGGMAWLEGGMVHYQKGMEAKDIYHKLKDIKVPALIHFRIATDGPIVGELTHPFPVTEECPSNTSGTAPLVLAHNGVWRGWRSVLLAHVREAHGKIKMPDGPWSDTRAMAFIAAHWGIGYLAMLLAPSNNSDECDAGKIAFLSPKGLAMHPFENWVKEDGWYQSRALPPLTSTTSHKGPSNDTPRKTQKGSHTPLPPLPMTIPMTTGGATTPPQPPGLVAVSGGTSQDESLTVEEFRELLGSTEETERLGLYGTGDINKIMMDIKSRYVVVD